MKLPRRKFLHLAAGTAALPAVSLAWAPAYPTRPVRIIVGFAAGGSADILARLMGQWLSERLGQPFVIENRPGAGSNIGTEAVVRAPPDGYTLLLASSANAIAASLYDRLNFDFIRDIAPVAGISRYSNVIVEILAVPWRLRVDRSIRISCSRSLLTSKSTGRPRLKRCVSNSLRRT